MKKLLGLALMAVMAGGALADAPELGMFFSATAFDQEHTNFNPAGAPFNAFIVFFPMGNVELVGGYEVGITVPASLFVLGASGPNGWTNFGSSVNHLAGYGFPLPAPEEGVVLCTLQVLYGAANPAVIEYGPANPQSVPGHDGPVIANGANPDDLISCWLVTGEINGVVATIFGGGVIAVENHTWTGVKSLFE
ncbi:MAG TPA: hypothetical protein PLL30_00265 [Candidatus Krumholzibacteria bacterium]|nr:hypothetical protein [Candidatus Krumholzibacteria bacterium]HPD70192.1 hypothetical protein [Candidatus Krumholzibacteria bacterium]HRY40108.1 hypothetical protein [Candidatus Krumholzibacteria bacterium]